MNTGNSAVLALASPTLVTFEMFHHDVYLYTMDLRDLGGKRIDVWVADSAVQKTPEVSSEGGARSKNGGITEILRTTYRKSFCKPTEPIKSVRSEDVPFGS